MHSPARSFESPLFPYAPRFCPVFAGGQNLEMAYVETGPVGGEPVVLLHGNPTWGFLYRDVMRPLAEHARVIVPDLIGFGRSDRLPALRDYTLDMHVSALTQLLDTLGVDGVTLVVHDWGGPIGLSWAVDHAKRVKRIVAMNTWAFTPAAHNQVPEPLRTFRKVPHGEALVLGLNAFVNVALPLGVFHKRRMHGEVMRAYRAPFPTMSSRLPVLAFPRNIPLSPEDNAFARMKRTDEGLRSLAAPTLLLWGARDPVFSPRVMRKFKERLHVVAEEVYGDASHFLQEDHGEDIGRAIRGFMQEASTSATRSSLA